VTVKEEHGPDELYALSWKVDISKHGL